MSSSPNVEPLEDRRYRAGITVTSDSDGVMRLTGDTSWNAIRVSRLTATEWRIEHAGDINGVPPAPGKRLARLDVRRPWSWLIVETGAEHDRIELTNLGSTVRLRVDAGAGNDDILIRGCSPPVAEIFGGRGNDTIDIRQSTGTPTFHIDGGSGNDRIGLRNLSTREISVAAGAGNDHVFLDGCRTRAAFGYTGGSGDDVFGARYTEFAGQSSVIDDAGRSSLSFYESRLYSRFQVETGPLDDELVLINCASHGQFRALLREGNDRYVQRNVVTGLYAAPSVDLGRGSNERDVI